MFFYIALEIIIKINYAVMRCDFKSLLEDDN